MVRNVETCLRNVEIRHHNGVCGYGRWIGTDDEWLASAVIDAVWEAVGEREEKAGVVEAGGSQWEFRTI